MIYADLEAGPHSFSVKAHQPGGANDPTPALRKFIVAPMGSGSEEEKVGSGSEEEKAFPSPPGASALEPFDGGPDRTSLFAPDSVWATPVSASAPIDPNSPRLVARLVAQIETERAAGGGPSLGTRSRTTLYEVGPDQPRVPVFLDTGPWGDQLAARFLEGVPIPPGALPVAGEDHAMTVWQPSTDSYWEFYDMRQALHAPQFARSPAVASGCSLPSGTYSYKLTSVNEHGETPAEVPLAKARVPEAGGCVTLRWGAIGGATAYRVYRGSEGSAFSYLATVPAGGVSFVDDGLSSTDGTLPPSVNSATTPGEWHASFGGFISEVSKNPGYYQDLTDSGGNILQQSHWGAAATGLPLAGGLITKLDVDRGRIDHALSLGLLNSTANSLLRAGEFAFPAQRSDGRSEDSDSIPEGARLVLDSRLDIDALGLTPFAHMLAEAAQKYGMIVHDGSLGTVIYAEDPAPYVAMGQANFYRPLIGSNSTRALRAFPWDHLQIAQMHLCTLRPCAAG